MEGPKSQKALRKRIVITDPILKKKADFLGFLFLFILRIKLTKAREKKGNKNMAGVTRYVKEFICFWKRT